MLQVGNFERVCTELIKLIQSRKPADNKLHSMVYLKLFSTRSLHIIIKIINTSFLPARPKTTNGRQGQGASDARCIFPASSVRVQCVHTHIHTMGQVNDLLHSRKAWDRTCTKLLRFDIRRREEGTVFVRCSGTFLHTSQVVVSSFRLPRGLPVECYVEERSQSRRKEKLTRRSAEGLAAEQLMTFMTSASQKFIRIFVWQLRSRLMLSTILTTNMC